MSLNIGDNAPNFTLKTKNADGLKDISLSDHQNKQAVVLLFFLSLSPVFVLKKRVL